MEGQAAALYMKDTPAGSNVDTSRSKGNATHSGPRIAPPYARAKIFAKWLSGFSSLIL
jgi:hypothetical protein